MEAAQILGLLHLDGLDGQPRLYAAQPGYPSASNGAVEITDGTYEWTETAGGVELKLYNPPKQKDGSYHNFYTFLYWLLPKDAGAMQTVIADTLLEENKQVLAHVTKGVAEYNNEAALVLTDGRRMADDADYAYEYNPTAKSVVYDEVNRVASYTVVLNGQRANLVDDGEADQHLTMTDEFSANLSVDYHSIRIYIDDETEPDTRNRVTYDYSGNVGTYVIPDETKVTITYDARVIAASGATASFENTVTMNGYKTTVTETRKIVSDSNSSAGVYQLQLFKYGNGNMQSGLAGAAFRLLDANKRPVLDRDGHEITFVTADDGYATITLDEHAQGVSLKKNTAYYLQELKAPIEVEDDNSVDYFRQDPTYYSFLISDNPNYAAPGGVYVYSNGDILKVRNFEDKGGLNISKSFVGNVALTDAQKAKISFRIEKQTASGGWSKVAEIPYTDFTYSDYEDQNGKRITGTYHYSIENLEVGGVYRVTERNADVDDEEVTHVTEYLVDGAAVTLRESDEEGAAETAYTGREGAGWTYTWSNLPKVYEDPERPGSYLEYEYQVIETKVGGAAVVNGLTSDGKYLVVADGMNVQNRKNEKSAEFGKQWRDDGGMPMDWLTAGGKTWFTTYSKQADRAGEGETIVNRDSDARLEVSKEWYDLAGKRVREWPEGKALTLYLHRKGEADALLTLADVAPGWRGEGLTMDGRDVTAAFEGFALTLTGLPAAKDGAVCEYYVTEAQAPGRASAVYGNSGEYNGIEDGAYHNGVIKNTMPTTSISFTKLWRESADSGYAAWPAGEDGQALPSTGGAGTGAYTLAGLGLIALALLLLFRRRMC